MLLTMILVTPTTTAYFWTDSPNSWDYDDEPPEGAEDGDGYSWIDTSGGASLGVNLFGGATQATADVIEYTEDEEGYVLMFVVAYSITANDIPPGGTDTFCVAKLELYHYDSGWGNPVDDMSASVQTIMPATSYSHDEGWLYVTMDVDYTDEPEFKLVYTVWAKYWNGFAFVDYQGSPVSEDVYFEVDDLT